MTGDLRSRVGPALGVVLALAASTIAVQPLVASTVAAQAASTSTAEAGVRDALQRYSAALESLDASAVKKVQPSVPMDNLAKAFKDMRELKVQIDEVRVLSTDGATARVSCKVTQTLTPRLGSKQTTSVTRILRLRRSQANGERGATAATTGRGAADTWVLDGFER